MKKRLLVILSMATMIFAAITELHQYYQTAQAYPCVGANVREYCTGYHDGAIQAHRDYNSEHDLAIGQHQCTIRADYCNGYNRGYSDEADFLGYSC
jgi:hypothetical protein